MTTYKGEKSGKIYTTSDGTKYSWSLSKKQIEFNSETSDGSNFVGYFRFIWTGDYEIRKNILKDYTHSHAIYEYRQTYLTKQASGKSGYSYGYALKFDTPVKNQFPLMPEHKKSKILYKYDTGSGTFFGELAKMPTSINREKSIKGYPWTNRIRKGWWLTKNKNGNNNTLSKPNKFSKKSADKITNFNPSSDTLEIDTDSFGIDNSATFATTKNKRKLKKLAKKDFDFLYDQKKGGLYFNENGLDKGFGDGGIIAILKGAPNLTSGNLDFI